MTAGRRRGWVALAGGWALLALVAGVWIALDRRPPEWDHANHLERALLCARDLVHGDVRGLLERSSFYPPLVLCSAGALSLLGLGDMVAAQAVMLLFLALGMAATYRLGRTVAGGFEGVAAALLFASAPFVVFSLLRFQLDLPLAAMLALALVVLLATEGFRDRRASALLGLVLGLGMLTKPPFAAYVLPPLVLVACRARDRRAWANLLLALGIGAVVGLPWYGPRLYGLGAQVASRSFAQAAESGHPAPLTVTALAFYPRWFVTQFGVAAAALFVVGLAIAVRRRLGLLLVALLVPFALFEVLQNKNLRYTLPLLPLAAVVAALGLGALRGRARAGAVAALVAAGAVQVSATAFAVPSGLTLPLLGAPLVSESPPMRTDWRHREILGLIARDSRGAAATVSIVPNHSFFSVSNFRYYGVRDGLPLRFTRGWDGEPLGVAYMVLKSGDVGPSWTAERPRRIAARLAEDADLARVYPVIGELGLPDGSTATLRARRTPAPIDARPAELARALEAAVRDEAGAFARELEGFVVRVAHDDGILQGRVRRLELEAAAATVAEFRRADAARLRIHDVRLVLEDLLVNPYSARAGRFAPLDAGHLRVERLTIREADLQAFLRGLKRFRGASVSLGEGIAAFSLVQPGPDVAARVRVETAGARPLALRAEGVRVGGVPVPGLLVNWVIRHYDPGPRLATRVPVPLGIGRVSVTPGAIHVSPR